MRAFLARHFDMFLYAAIAGLSSAQALVTAHVPLASTEALIPILLATLIAIKAKRSKGQNESTKE